MRSVFHLVHQDDVDTGPHDDGNLHAEEDGDSANAIHAGSGVVWAMPGALRSRLRKWVDTNAVPENEVDPASYRELRVRVPCGN